jgi:hypothetical protein
MPMSIGQTLFLSGLDNRHNVLGFGNGNLSRCSISRGRNPRLAINSSDPSPSTTTKYLAKTYSESFGKVADEATWTAESAA